MFMSPERMSADERRETVITASVAEFAHGGLRGTSTEAIAARAGISQPYLFRLFPTKKDLFIAMVRRVFEMIETRFIAASEGLSGDDALLAMGAAYNDLLADRDVLLAQLQTYAACGDPDIQAESRTGYGRLWSLVEGASGASEERLEDFFAKGMLLNVVAALDLVELRDRWAQACVPDSVRS
jgi:AcrR family transcriptional regulator